MATPKPATTVLVDPAQYRRHPLGLPQGSVRSILAVLVFSIYGILLLLPEEHAALIPVYLYYLMFLIIGHYFASQSRHHVTPGERPALYLPRGTVRFLVVLGLVGVMAWGFTHNPDFADRLKPDTTQLAEHAYTPLIIMGAFFLGILAARVAYHVLGGSRAVPSWVQDVQAWVSMLAVLGMLAEVLIRLVINPRLDPSQQLHLPTWEGILAAVVAFYFGARS